MIKKIYIGLFFFLPLFIWGEGAISVGFSGSQLFHYYNHGSYKEGREYWDLGFSISAYWRKDSWGVFTRGSIYYPLAMSRSTSLGDDSSSWIRERVDSKSYDLMAGSIYIIGNDIWELKAGLLLSYKYYSLEQTFHRMEEIQWGAGPMICLSRYIKQSGFGLNMEGGWNYYPIIESLELDIEDRVLSSQFYLTLGMVFSL